MVERSTKIDIDGDKNAAETALLGAAVAVARASELKVPHDEMRDWLLKLADGDFAATPPEPHLPSALPGLVPGIHGATVQPPNGCQTSRIDSPNKAARKNHAVQLSNIDTAACVPPTFTV